MLCVYVTSVVTHDFDFTQLLPHSSVKRNAGRFLFNGSLENTGGGAEYASRYVRSGKVLLPRMRSLLVWTLLHSTPYFERLMPSPDVRRDAPSTASADCSGRSGRFPGCCWRFVVRRSVARRARARRGRRTLDLQSGPQPGPVGCARGRGREGRGRGGRRTLRLYRVAVLNTRHATRCCTRLPAARPSPRVALVSL